MPAPGLLIVFSRWRGVILEATRPERVLTRHDTHIVPRAQFFNEYGVALPLTGLTVRYTLKESAGVIFKIDREAVTLENQTAYPGMCYYPLAAADIDEAGVYYEEWEVDWGGGSKETFPANSTPQTVRILADLDDM